MSPKRPDGPEALIAPLYLVAILLVATPAMDFATSIIPIRLGDIEWRFASVGLLSGFLLTPLLGVALAMGVAQFGGHLRFQRILAVLNLLVTVAFAILLVFFLLDVLQLQGSVPAESKPAFASAALKALIKHACFIVALAFLAWRGMRVSRWSSPDKRRGPASVVVGA